MKNEEKDDMTTADCLGMILGLLSIPTAIFWHGYVLSDLWTFFLVPLLPSVPALSVLQASGLMLLIRHLLPSNSNKKGWDLLAHVWLAPALVWFMARLILWAGN